jgi:predicted anti-sigma-YlaC factor YlaD
MSNHVHERACKLALSARIEGRLAAADRDWLDAHLSACAGCRDYSDGLERALGGMRSLAPTAGDALVRSTQWRVRQRAAELRARQAMMHPLWVASAMVVLSSVVVTPLLWQAFAWMGRMAQVSDLAWRSAFVLVWISPAIAASFLLLASGYAGNWREARMSTWGGV